MLVVYEHNESVCCQKVRMTLEEKEIAYRSINVALEAGEQLTPSFLQINPKGVVPVLVHDGRTITESTIITEYLDDAFPSHPLMPREAYWRARRRHWARRIDDEMHIPHIATISFIIAFGRKFRQHLDTREKVDAYLESVPGAQHRETMRNAFAEDLGSTRLHASLRAFDTFLEEIELALGQTPWLAGQSFSLADIDVAPYVWRLSNLQLGVLWARRPRVADWLARVSARRGFRKGVIENALPEWVELMRYTGNEARPILEPVIADFNHSPPENARIE